MICKYHLIFMDCFMQMIISTVGNYDLSLSLFLCLSVCLSLSLSHTHTLYFSVLSFFSFTEAFLSVACSHERSYIYFAESLAAEPCKFTAYPCDSYEDFVKGTCNVCGDSPCPVMGNDAILSQSRRGNFYLVTNAQNPYCSKWE